MDTALRHRVQVARSAVLSQVGLLRDQLGRVPSDWKADDTRVTFADFAISEQILRQLRSSFPEDAHFSEESICADESGPIPQKYVWVLDPIDGTNNFALGMWNCAISLALLKDGKPCYGWIYDASSGELAEGGPGQPLRVNQRRLPIGPERSLEARSSVVAVHFPLRAGRASQLASLLETYRLRSLGSSALHLAYVALGRIDGAIDEKVRLWDFAAACALLAAAGRAVRFAGPQPFPLRDLAGFTPIYSLVAGSAPFTAAAENWLG